MTETKFVTIEPGTYIFKDIPDTVSVQFGEGIDINFKVKGSTYSWNKILVDANSRYGVCYFTSENPGWNVGYVDIHATAQSNYVWGNYDASVEDMDGDADENVKTITIETAQNVPENFVTWFNANTTKQVPRKSYDLSTSAKWATLTAGNHNVQIVAKASGYRDSEKSAAVTVNKTIISAGTYKFNDTISAPASGSATAFIHFKVNDTSYNSISATSLVSVMYTATLGEGLTVYNNTDKWAAVDTANQIITITADKEVPYKFYEWFTANASAYTPTYTLEAGTYKFADSLDWNHLPSQSLLFQCNNTNYIKFDFERVTDTYLAKLRYFMNDTHSIYVCNVTEDGSMVWYNSVYKQITLSTSQQVSAEFYKWAITDGNLVKQEPTYNDCITFTGQSSDFNLSVGKRGAKQWNGTVQYSTDHSTWTTWDGTAISSVDKKLYLRGKNNTKFYTSKGAHLSLSAKAGCSGNIQTLLDYENPPTSISTAFCYHSLFFGCTNLISAPELPAITLSESCYASMFYGCINLKSAPELPATTLAENCYSSMFRECTNLTIAPELSVTTLAKGCYSYMFRDCTSLKVAPELSATTLAENCYLSMFNGCTSLTSAPSLPATILAPSCYSNMFDGCTSLMSVPELSATTLAQYCYYWMFDNCTSLKVNTTSGTKIFTCPSDIPSNAVTNMFYNTGGSFKGTPVAGNTYYWYE